MNMSVNVHEFYYEASKRILGTMVFEKSMQDLLKFLRNYIPGNYLSLHFFDAGLGIIETVIDTTPQKSELISKISTLSQQARVLIQESLKGPTPYCMIIENPGEDEMIHQLGLDFKAPNDPIMAMDLEIDGELIGFISLTSTEGQMYNEDHVTITGKNTRSSGYGLQPVQKNKRYQQIEEYYFGRCQAYAGKSDAKCR